MKMKIAVLAFFSFSVWAQTKDGREGLESQFGIPACKQLMPENNPGTTLVEEMSIAASTCLLTANRRVESRANFFQSENALARALESGTEGKSVQTLVHNYMKAIGDVVTADRDFRVAVTDALFAAGDLNMGSSKQAAYLRWLEKLLVIMKPPELNESLIRKGNEAVTRVQM